MEHGKIKHMVLLLLSCTFFVTCERSSHSTPTFSVHEVLSVDSGDSAGQVNKVFFTVAENLYFEVDRQGNIIILDHWKNHRIHKWSPNGSLAWAYQIKVEIPDAPVFLGPVDREGNIYVAEVNVNEAMAKNYRALHKVSPAGKLVYRIRSASLEYGFYDTNYYVEDSGEVSIIGFSRRNWNKPVLVQKYSPSGVLVSEGTEWTGCCCNKDCECGFPPFLNWFPLCTLEKSLKDFGYGDLSGPDKKGNYFSYQEIDTGEEKEGKSGFVYNIEPHGTILWELSPVILEKYTPYTFSTDLDEIAGGMGDLNYNLDKYVVGEWLYANGYLYALAECPKCDKGFLKIFRLDIKD